MSVCMCVVFYKVVVYVHLYTYIHAHALFVYIKDKMVTNLLHPSHIVPAG